MLKRNRSHFYRLVLLSFCINIIVLCMNCKAHIDVHKNKRAPVALTVEYIRQPEKTLIIDSTPEFAWELANIEDKQSAYQVLVASSEALINTNKGDLWNSNKVISSQSINVTFKGNKLNIGDTYFWKVKIWDANDKETLFSQYQSFTIGKQEKVITSRNILQIDKIQSQYSKQINENSYFLDFGKDAFANLKIKYKTKIKDTLIVRIGE